MHYFTIFIEFLFVCLLFNFRNVYRKNGGYEAAYRELSEIRKKTVKLKKLNDIQVVFNLDYGQKKLNLKLYGQIFLLLTVHTCYSLKYLCISKKHVEIVILRRNDRL